jgi:hypothetical protein
MIELLMILVGFPLGYWLYEAVSKPQAQLAAYAAINAIDAIDEREIGER